MRPEVVVVGAACRDLVRRRSRAAGGSAAGSRTAALTLARLGLRGRGADRGRRARRGVARSSTPFRDGRRRRRDRRRAPAARCSSTPRRRPAASSTRRRSRTRSIRRRCPTPGAARARGCSAPVAAEIAGRAGRAVPRRGRAGRARLAGPAAGPRGRRAGRAAAAGAVADRAPGRPRRRRARRLRRARRPRRLAAFLHPGATHAAHRRRAGRRGDRRGRATGRERGAGRGRAIPIARFVDPVGAGRHVPRRRVRRARRPDRIIGGRTAPTTRTCGSGPPRVADPARAPGVLRRARLATPPCAGWRGRRRG